MVVVCDKSKLDDKGCAGAPDMVVEILSPSTASYDIVVKTNIYMEAGVREYWIVNPETRTVSAHILENGKYNITYFGTDNPAKCHVLEGLEINLADVFAEEQ